MNARLSSGDRCSKACSKAWRSLLRHASYPHLATRKGHSSVLCSRLRLRGYPAIDCRVPPCCAPRIKPPGAPRSGGPGGQSENGRCYSYCGFERVEVRFPVFDLEYSNLTSHLSGAATCSSRAPISKCRCQNATVRSSLPASRLGCRAGHTIHTIQRTPKRIFPTRVKNYDFLSLS